MQGSVITQESDEEYALPEQLAALSARIDEAPESLALGNKDIQVAALQATKYVFDLALQSESKSRAVISELLGSMVPSMAPQTRSQAASTKTQAIDPAKLKAPELFETPLPELVVDDMDREQIWAQLELRAQNVSKVLEFALESTGELPESDDEIGNSSFMKIKDKSLEEKDSDEMDSDTEEDEDESEDESESEGDGESAGEEEDQERMSDAEDGENAADLGEEITNLRDEDENDAMNLDASGPSRAKHRRGGSKGHPELDDGFFDLAAFNAQTEAFEARNVSRGHLGEDDDEDENDEDADLFASVDDAHDEGPEEPYYHDFFAPPSRRTMKTPGMQPQKSGDENDKSRVRFHDEVRVKSIKAKGKNLLVGTMFETVAEEDGEDGFGEKMSDSEEDNEWDDERGPPSSQDDENMDQDGEESEMGSEEASDGGLDTQETIERLKDDLFADEDEDEDDKTADMSTHERRMAALREEIASLEAENVAEKHWTLMGEATSRSRPHNALLEEDLDFDRMMKSVPIITEEIVQSLEEVIKNRILENRFDDVVRKRPLDDKPFLPSRFFELQDTKSKQSLAEIYEGEYLAAKTGGVAGEDRDGKLKKEHEELEKIWENLCSKMDALSNAHFTPRAPKASISTVSNIASATMESALPTTKTSTTMLAPEEIFAPSPADLRAKSEMTPTEKRALRNKQKKAKRKARGILEKSVDQFARMKGQSVKKQKEAALKSVVKSGKGVTVIGKKSQELSMNGGKKVRS